MIYDYKEKKTVVVLASNLEVGTALNVVGHLAISLGNHAPNEIMGRTEYIDKTGEKHTGISKYPVIVTKVKINKVRRTIAEARENASIIMIDYPKEMLTTGHDDELNEAINNSEEEDIEYLGVILYGDSSDIDEITGKFMLWK